MVDQLNAFASEVTRVAREVGTEGKLGGQADVRGVAGTWKDLTDNVNWMASNLTTQVRGIARVVTAVANGDLNRKLVLEAKGEIAELVETINGMTDTLAVFSDQVISVAREVGIEGKLGGQARVPGASGQWRDLTDNVNQLAGNLTTQVRAIAEVATAVTAGDLSRSIAVEAQGEVAVLKDNINTMIRNLKETTLKNTEQDWLKTNLARFTRMLQGQRDMLTVSQLILSELAPLIDAQHAVMFLPEGADGTMKLKLLASYGLREHRHFANEFKLGEGLVGQCALEKERILVRDVPHGYIAIHSGLGEARPYNIVILPVLFESEIMAVIELASFQRFSDIHLTFLDQLTESIGIVLNTLAANMRTEDLLKQSQSLTQELRSQQEELREKNSRLEQQALSLQRSEELLREQQDELQKTNSELEEKANLLTLRNREVERKNEEVERAKWALEEKAEQLALTSKYKSEFLANMSHELRTPLNSLLILSELLSKNEGGHLTPKQVEFARTIHSSGSDLLGLINDILDLSKIESGAMDVDLSRVPLADLSEYVERSFRPVAEGKGLTFTVALDPALPAMIRTDARRLQQVLKNLLSNAFKFTERGSVALEVGPAAKGWNPEHRVLNRADLVVSFTVRDTGIGIPRDKHRIIFEAFQQADGTTSRKYGGTGLGLSISREIAVLLGGEITLASAPGQGSAFTLYLPSTHTPRLSGADERLTSPMALEPRLATSTEAPGGTAMMEKEPVPAFANGPDPVETEVVDDRSSIQPGEKVLLIIEDDAAFARIVLDTARQLGFKGLVTSRAGRAIALAREYKPSAITLDLHLPDADGWTVLDRLKRDPALGHIPIHVMSVEDDGRRARKLGAFAYLHKPANADALGAAIGAIGKFLDRPVKELLVLEKDEAARRGIVELIGNGDVRTTAVGSAEEALAALEDAAFDCVVLESGLDDQESVRLVESLKREGRPQPPIVLHAERGPAVEEARLAEWARDAIVKVAPSKAHVLAETALYLHRAESRLPASQREMLERSRELDPTLAGRKVLVVDDDVRNIFALSSVLEQQKMNVLYAESGAAAIALLQATPDLDIVLMDIMMPEMDGYETMRAIRAMPEFQRLPIVALTAKAMPGDREKCFAAGASAYVAKPVDSEQLFSLLRVALCR
jgi:signal transduction histidine kinase/CheY-like chemotaxis protein/HAMP domain-containing protein